MDQRDAPDPKEAEVRLVGWLAARAGCGLLARATPGQTIAEVAAAMGVPPQQRYLATVNGRACSTDYVLAPGDRAILFPPIAGG
jgi:molybdopterin converting factor small subunit